MANEFNIKNGFISANDSVVNGKLTTQNLRIISGATSGYVLTSDASGNAIWQPTSGSFTGGTVTGSTIFTNGLTANTISATTYQNLPIDVYVTGGTYSSGTLSLTNITGGTFTVTGFSTGGGSGDSLTGGTFDYGTGTLSLSTTASTINITGFTDLYVTGGTYSNGVASFTNNTGGTFNVTGFYTGATDIFVTGGTYSAGTTTFTNNTGGTFSVVGFYTGETSYVNSITTGTGLSGSSTTGNITLINTSPDQVVTLSGGTGILTGGTYPNFTITNSQPDQIVSLTEGDNIDIQGTYPNFTITVTGLTDNDRFTTGFTYGNNTFTLSDNSGATLNATINQVTGLTVNGNLLVQTISATTYQNLPTDVRVTGGTYSNGSATFTNNTGGTFNVVGFYTGGTDVFVTGGTYSAGTASFTNNTGSTFSVTGFSTFQYFISGTSPSGVTLNIGDRWYNDNNGVEYVWNYDGNSYQWVQPAGIPGPQGVQGIQGVSGNTGPQGIQGDPGFSGLLVTTGITATTQTLSTGYTYYGIVHSTNVDLTLPNPTGIDGFNLNVKDESGNSGIYRIRITTPIGTIDGGSYVDMNINYMSLQFVARNNNWWII
jgi:hypothetical protein